MNRFFYIASFLLVFMAVTALAIDSVISDSIGLALSADQAALLDKSGLGRNDQEISSSNESLGSILLTPVTVTNGGKMNLTSGQSIVLKPGTRVLSGGYFRATILVEAKEPNSGIPQYRKSKKQVITPKKIAPLILAESEGSISPFAKKSLGKSIEEGDDNEESLNALISEASGISPEQNRKPSGYITMHLTFNSGRIAKSRHYHFIASTEKRETTSVLRL